MREFDELSRLKIRKNKNAKISNKEYPTYKLIYRVKHFGIANHLPKVFTELYGV
jgi:hypothetical protein